MHYRLLTSRCSRGGWSERVVDGGWRDATDVFLVHLREFGAGEFAVVVFVELIEFFLGVFASAGSEFFQREKAVVVGIELLEFIHNRWFFRCVTSTFGGYASYTECAGD